MKIGRLLPVWLMLTASLASAQDVTRCGGPSNGLYVNWQDFQFDVCHTGYNPYEHIIGPNNVASLSVLWAGSYPSENASPVVANGVVYFADGRQPLCSGCHNGYTHLDVSGKFLFHSGGCERRCLQRFDGR